MAQSISENEIQKIAHLSRIAATEADIQEAKKYLASILEYEKKLSEVSSEDAAPYALPAVSLQALREDVAENFKERAKLFRKHSLTQEGLLRTKGVFSKRDGHTNT